MNLCVLISTLDNRIFRLEKSLLPAREDISYVISHQVSSNIFDSKFDFLNRQDIILNRIYGTGVTKSRNNAINLAQGDIGLFSDDDVFYKDEYLDVVIRTFHENPDLDVGIFKIKTLPGEPEYKNFPTEVIKYDKKAPSVGTVQIAIKLKSIKDNKIWFDERFGAGNKFLIGSDEMIFVQDCLNAGLTVKYYPEYVVIHPYESTIKSIPLYDNRRIRVAGGIDARINGPIAIPKSFIGTIKFLPDLIKHKKNPIIYFWERFRAAVYITFTKTTK